MRLTHKQLINLPVETKSGTTLGKICGFELDPFSQRIMTYTVKAHPNLPKIIEGELLIAFDQVIELTNEKMVVDDLVVKERETGKAKKPIAA